MASVARALRAQHPRDKLNILVAKRNAGSFTYDGIELGGERACNEIEEELQAIESRGGKIKKISIAGYSLGGLVARYAIGLLYARGVLDNLDCMVWDSRGTIWTRQQADVLVLDIYGICQSIPRSAHPSSWLGKSGMERTRCAYTLHVRETTFRY